MKKIIAILLAVFICFAFSVTAFAEEDEEAAVPETTVDSSQPRLMVTEFTVDGGSIMPDKETEVSITLKNYSSSKAIRNIKLTISDESGDIKPVGTGTQFVNSIYAGSTYTWKVSLTAAKAAAIGDHTVTVSSEYEDKYYTSYSSSDNFRVPVKQTASLDYNGVMLPSKLVQEETATVDMTFMNTGKSKIRNIKVDIAVDGLESGGTAYIGEIDIGANASASVNLRANADAIGDVSGTATITYEDEFGEQYTKTEELSATIEEREELPEIEEEEQPKYPLWWAFLLGGLVLGGGIGAAIPIIIHSNKQRKIDEAML